MSGINNYVMHEFTDSVKNDLQDYDPALLSIQHNDITLKDGDTPEPAIDGTLNISPKYPDVLEELILTETDGVTIFNGAPLEYQHDGRSNGYVRPAVIRDKDGFSVFNIIYLGTDGKPIDDLGNVRVTVSYAPDVLVKLGAADSKVVIFQQKLQSKSSPQVIIKLAQEANIAFPEFNLPGYNEIPPDIVTSRLSTLLHALHDPPISNPPEPETFYERLEVEWEMDDVILMKPIPVETQSNGTVFASLVYLIGDPWKYYWIFSYDTPTDLARFHDKNVKIRVDSGCDTGMILGDQGCECHQQLIDALGDIKAEGGIIVHIPSQDGRGYGMATKLETEAIKQGTPSATMPDNIQPTDTITAAMRVFGESGFDIRTYAGVGRLLYHLGFEGIQMITDNKEKVAGVETGAGFKNDGTPRLLVTRIPTYTLGKNPGHPAAEHVRAKHDTETYYDS